MNLRNSLLITILSFHILGYVFGVLVEAYAFPVLLVTLLGGLIGALAVIASHIFIKEQGE